MTSSSRAGTVLDSSFRLADVLSALSSALDIAEGQPPGHAVRSCLIGMRLAQAIGFPEADRGSLFYALLLKDLGCSSKASRLGTRCDRGAEIAAMLGFPDLTREAIRTLDEHWDGRGMPDGLAGEAIPLGGRILGLAQAAEVFASGFGVDAALAVARERRGTWFDPALVDALRSVGRDREFWARALGPAPSVHLAALAPEDEIVAADDAKLDRIAEAFARVIDAKSPFTFRHSEGVAEAAVGIGRMVELEAAELRDLRRAALLHDIGKLGVSNLILDKPAVLTEAEMAQVRLHPMYTYRILSRVPAFHGIGETASAHHERIDGKGYHVGLPGERLDAAPRALAVAEVYEALTADRPYRAGLPREEVLKVLRREAGAGLCPESVEALVVHLGW